MAVAALLAATSTLDSARRLSAGAAVALIVAVAFVPEGSLADRLSAVALVAVGFAAASGWIIAWAHQPNPPLSRMPVNNRISSAWLIVALIVALTAGLVVQTWFHPGTAIAGGDTDLPNGTGWLSRLFEPWTWSGAALGEPSQLPLSLPWAAVLAGVRSVGGSPETAQRIWYTTIYVAAALGAFGLLASLRIGPIAAFAGSAVYVLNPYVLTWVNTFDNYIVALFLVAAIPAALIAAGTGRLKIWWSATLVAFAAPLIGYAFLSPPLVGMIVGVMLLAPLATAWVHGRTAGRRSLLALLLALPMLLGTSAYWTIPAILHLVTLIPTQLADPSGWTWAEGRATIRNAFWLNVHWAWNYFEYFPYSRAYETPAISVARFLLPAMAFATLALGRTVRRRDLRAQRDRQIRIAIAAATLAFAAIVFSTGTNPPGSIVFDPLYNLPFGWLLREPARFLMLAGLAYSILVGLFVDALIGRRPTVKTVALPHRNRLSMRPAVAPLAISAAVLVGFPFYSGSFVPDTGRTLPIWANHARATHVQMPSYWPSMARYVDSLPIQGAVLIMPPDDFYEMPYSWYYGTDTFVIEMFNRHVLVPNLHGYTPASTEILGAVNLTAQSILAKNWRQTEALLNVMDAPLILVRGDVQVPFPGRSIVPPNQLSDALLGSPTFTLMRHFGPLQLFGLRNVLRATETTSNFALVQSKTPDLRLLSVLPPDTALVTGEPRPDTSTIVEVPPMDSWVVQDNSLSLQMAAPSGSKYRIAELASGRLLSLDRQGTFFVTDANSPPLFSMSTDPALALESVQGARSAISDGAFAQGLWGPVGDCGGGARRKKPQLGAKVVPNAAPGGLPALQLSATGDIACESRPLSWRGGPLVLSLMVNHVQGSLPRLCLGEKASNTCAPLPPVPDGHGWSAYRAIVTPGRASTLQLVLYADPTSSGDSTINEYANVQVTEVPALPAFSATFVPGGANTASITLSVAGRQIMRDGNFAEGLWGPVADCNSIAPIEAEPTLNASVLDGAGPGGSPALRLSASLDSACERQAVAWHSGPIAFSLWIHHVEGSAPRMCLWETGPDRCAQLPVPPTTTGWFSFHSTATIDPGTKGLTLYLYADAANSGGETINEYAHISMVEIPSLYSFALLSGATHAATSALQLVVVHSSFSTNWQSTSGQHVLVDGMLNGWLISKSAGGFSARYVPSSVFLMAEWVSLVFVILLVLVSSVSAIAIATRSRLKARRRGPR